MFMETNVEGISTKKKNEKFLEALKTLSDQDPKSSLKSPQNCFNGALTTGGVLIPFSQPNSIHGSPMT